MILIASLQIALDLQTCSRDLTLGNSATMRQKRWNFCTHTHAHHISYHLLKIRRSSTQIIITSYAIFRPTYEQALSGRYPQAIVS